jgi:uncharacterized protein (TIGR02118 family)
MWVKAVFDDRADDASGAVRLRMNPRDVHARCSHAMYRISILYPKTEGTTFDHDYYTASHMPMLADRLGDNCTGWGADKVIDGPFEAIGYVHVGDLGAFGATMTEHGAEILGDVPNYTGITPQLVVSEVPI